MLNNTGFAYAVEAGAGISIAADLAISKHATPGPVVAGEALTYTLRVTNTGTVAHSVVLTDVLPGLASFAAASPGCSQSLASSVIAGDSQWTTRSTVTVTAAIDPAATDVITNSATVWAPPLEPATDNNHAQLPTRDPLPNWASPRPARRIRMLPARALPTRLP